MEQAGYAYLQLVAQLGRFLCTLNTQAHCACSHLRLITVAPIAYTGAISYTHQCRGSVQERRHQLYPAADTLGGWHSVAIEHVKKLGIALAQNQGQEEQE